MRTTTSEDGMYRFSDLGTQQAAPAWIALAVVAFDWATRIEIIRSRIGDNLELSSFLLFAAVVWLVWLVISGRSYRLKTADMLTDLWNYGLNQLLHLNVDDEKAFHHWLNRYGAWQADVNQVMARRHCTVQQRNDVANLHKFVTQPTLFHADPERNWWKSMMSETLDRVAKVADELAGRR